MARYFRLKKLSFSGAVYQEVEFTDRKTAEIAYLKHVFELPDHKALLWEYVKIKTPSSNTHGFLELGHKLIAGRKT